MTMLSLDKNRSNSGVTRQFCGHESSETPATNRSELLIRSDPQHSAVVVNATQPTVHHRLRSLYLTGGLLCVALGGIGVLLPGLPTTPFLLLASWCFSRSSPRLESALLRSRLFGPLIRDWRHHRAIRRPIRNLAAAMVMAMILATCVFSPVSIALKAIIFAFGGVGIFVVMSLPVISASHEG